MTKYGEPLRWLRQAVLEETEDCQLWPFSILVSSGYGQLRYEGRMWKAHQVALVLVGRERPEPGMVTRHKCNTPACVNTQHLIVGTRRANAADRLGHSLPLTKEQVLSIRADPRRNVDVAKEYGIAQCTVSMIRSGKRWGKFE